jgi:hypothetical protein
LKLVAVALTFCAISGEKSWDGKVVAADNDEESRS